VRKKIKKEQVMMRFRRAGDGMQGGKPCVHEAKGLLAYACNRGEIFLNSLSGELIGNITIASQDRATAMQFSQDGNILVASTFGGTVEMWSLKDEKPRQVLILASEKGIQRLAVTNDGKLLLAATETKVYLYSLELGECLQSIDIVQSPLTGMHFYGTGFILVENDHFIDRYTVVTVKPVEI
jgi:WD40 repeat protein